MPTHVSKVMNNLCFVSSHINDKSLLGHRQIFCHMRRRLVAEKPSDARQSSLITHLSAWLDGCTMQGAQASIQFCRFPIQLPFRIRISGVNATIFLEFSFVTPVTPMWLSHIFCQMRTSMFVQTSVKGCHERRVSLFPRAAVVVAHHTDDIQSDIWFPYTPPFL